MKKYLICESLKECEELKKKTKNKFVKCLSLKEYEKSDAFNESALISEKLKNKVTVAEVHYASLCGCVNLINHKNIEDNGGCFAFILKEDGVTFIDDSGFINKAVSHIQKTKKWNNPSIERFFYDLLEYIISDDLNFLHAYETRLRKLEDNVLKDELDDVIENVNEIRGDLIDLKIYYEDLFCFVEEFEENENDFFKDDNLRYFHMIENRIEHFLSSIQGMKDYCSQIRDLYQSNIDIKTNKKMNLLTLISTIFFPLTVITGWFGMNFKYMPELYYTWSYPLLICLCLAGIIIAIIYLRITKM